MDSPSSASSKSEKLPKIDASASNSISRITVEEQMFNLRNELRQSYEVITKARDTLANISFEKMKQESYKLNHENLETDIDVIMSTVSVKDSLSRLSTKIRNKAREEIYRNSAIPEVNSFFRALDDLDEGIKGIETHKESLKTLNSEVKNSMLDFQVNIEKDKAELKTLNASATETDCFPKMNQ